jgi:tetratricopeptide (TPR) repeat protein
MTGSGRNDPVGQSVPGEGLPADDHRVQDSGFVAGDSVQMAGYNVAGRDLAITVTGHNAAGRDLIQIHQYFASNSDAAADAFIQEQLLALPPAVREAIGQLQVQDRALAAGLAGILANRRATPSQIVQDLTGTPVPALLAAPTTPVDAWVAVGEFASAHGSYRAAAATFAKVAELGGPVRAVWLARAALAMAQTDDQQTAGGYLDDAEGLAGGEEPFVSAVRAALAGDAAGVLAAAGSHDLATLEPVEFAMLGANAYAAQGDRDTAITVFEALAERYSDLGGFALRAAQLRLERVVQNTSPGHADDIRRARQLALRARRARRPWRGDSAEAVVVACHAAMIASDFDRVLAYGLATPAGEADPAEAMAPAVLDCAATAAIALGRLDLAVQLIDQIPDPGGRAVRLGQLAERDPSTAEQARAAYHRAFRLATDDSQRLEIVQGLAELGEWPLPWIEELQAHSSEHAEYLTAMSELARGLYDEAIRRLRPWQATSRMAARLLAEAQRRGGQIDDSVQTLRAVARRFSDPHSLTSAAMTLFEAGRRNEARTAAIEALSTIPPDSSDRSRLRRLLSDEAAERHDWPEVEQQARAMLDEGVTDPDARWLLILALTNQGRIEAAWTIMRQAPLEATNEQQARLWLALHGRFASDAATVEQALELLERYGQSEEFAAAGIMTLIMMTRNATLPESTVARLQQTTSTFFERFPSSMLLKRITVDFDDPEAVLAEFRRQLEPGAAQYAEVRRQVVRGELPIGMLAVAAGKPYTEALLRRGPGFLPAYSAGTTLAEQERQLATDALDGTVVVEPSALNLVSLIPDRWPNLLAAFAHVQIPDASLDDILTTRDGLALRSTTSMGWDPDQQRMVMGEISQADADQLADRAAWVARTALSLEAVEVGALSQFPEMDSGHARSWLAPLEAAKQQGAAVLSDDVVLRGLAHSFGIPAFGSIAAFDALVDTGHLDPATRDAAVLELRRNWVVDLPFDAEQLRAVAEADQWRPGPAYFGLTRPAAWQDRQQALAFYRAGQDQITTADPVNLPQWLHAAILGFAAGQPPSGVTFGAGLLLSLTTLQANMDPGIFAKLIPAARQAAAELGGGDPLPQTIRDIAAIFVEALGHAEGARYALLHAFSALDPADRLLAVRELITGRS